MPFPLEFGVTQMKIVRTFVLTTISTVVIAYAPPVRAEDSSAANRKAVSVKTQVVTDRSTGDVKACRRMVTGPDVNEHPNYPGCTGFVGWESVMRRGNGEMLCSFSAGYWHVSFPTPIDVKPDVLKSYQRAGLSFEARCTDGWTRSDLPVERQRQDVVATHDADRHSRRRPASRDRRVVRWHVAVRLLCDRQLVRL